MLSEECDRPWKGGRLSTVSGWGGLYAKVLSTKKRMIVRIDEEPTMWEEFARFLKNPGASEGLDPSTVASTSTSYP